MLFLMYFNQKPAGQDGNQTSQSFHFQCKALHRAVGQGAHNALHCNQELYSMGEKVSTTGCWS